MYLYFVFVIQYLFTAKISGHLKIWVEGHVAGGAVPPAIPAVVAVATLAT